MFIRICIIRLSFVDQDKQMFFFSNVYRLKVVKYKKKLIYILLQLQISVQLLRDILLHQSFQNAILGYHLHANYQLVANIFY